MAGSNRLYFNSAPTFADDDLHGIDKKNDSLKLIAKVYADISVISNPELWLAVHFSRRLLEFERLFPTCWQHETRTIVMSTCCVAKYAAAWSH
ncbi:hypothetical protein BsWGS_17196 [Bradybaena similaris]